MIAEPQYVKSGLNDVVVKIKLIVQTLTTKC